MSVVEPSAIGIDLGSRATKIVRLEGDRVTDRVLFETGHSPLEKLMSALEGLRGDVTVATGYGRNLAMAHLTCRTITEIRACARAAKWLCGDCDGAIDIGGQDSKAIQLRDDGGFERFEMNDRCAAGTGKFLEVVAGALGFDLEAFGREALKADCPVTVNSMCTVFAESEVISLIARKEDRRRIALGLHVATARRVAAMAGRIGPRRKALFVGGVAHNPCMVQALRDELECELVVPEHPQFAVALGAALIGREDVERQGGGT